MTESVPRPRQLGAILDVLGIDLGSLFGEFNEETGKRRDRVVGWLYRILDTLDSKTSHLLRFAGLLLAAQTFLAGVIVRNDQTSKGILRFVLVLLVVPLGTTVFGVSIFRVRWRFFGKVRASNEAEYSEERVKDEIYSLAKLCDERSVQHNRSFYWCILSAVAFLLTLVSALYVFW